MTTHASKLTTRSGSTLRGSASGVKVGKNGEWKQGHFSGLVKSDPFSLGHTSSNSTSRFTNKSAVLNGGRFAALEKLAAENSTATSTDSVQAHQPRVGFFKEELFGVEMRVIMPFVAVLGVTIGMCLGLALYGTKAHTMLVGSLSFLGQ